MHFVQSAGWDYKAASAICSLVIVWSHLVWPSLSHFHHHHHALTLPPTFYNISGGSTALIDHIPITIFSLTPRLQTRNHGPPRTANERRQHPYPPMPCMWHRCWGIGNTPNKWVPHDAVPSSPPLLTPRFQTSNHSASRMANERPHTWGIRNTPNGVSPIPVAFTAPLLTPRLQTSNHGANAHDPVAVTTCLLTCMQTMNLVICRWILFTVLLVSVDNIFKYFMSSEFCSVTLVKLFSVCRPAICPLPPCSLTTTMLTVSLCQPPELLSGEGEGYHPEQGGQLVLLHFVISIFLVLFIQSTIFTRMLCSWDRWVDEK